MIINLGYRRPYTAASATNAYLADVIASTVCDLDATIAASYPGTGTTWANLVATPADGAAKTDYDFFTGNGATATTYPAFNGSAGSAASYWSFDGGDYFSLKSGANSAFLNALHKTTGGADWWAAITFRMADDAGAGFKFWGTSTGGSSNPGIADQLRGDNTFRSQQRGASSSTADSTATLSNGVDYLVISSHSHSTNTTRLWIASTTAESKSQTYSTSTDNAANTLKIGANGAAAQAMPNGSRLYSFAMGNEFIDNTKAAAIYTHLGARHGRTYA